MAMLTISGIKWESTPLANWSAYGVKPWLLESGIAVPPHRIDTNTVYLNRYRGMRERTREWHSATSIANWGLGVPLLTAITDSISVFVPLSYGAVGTGRGAVSSDSPIVPVVDGVYISLSVATPYPVPAVTIR